MNIIELSRLDLNLLVALAALLEEGSVTQAGRRLGRTPSAMSHALGRLREALGDPLLVRSGQGLAPTPTAEALREPLKAALCAVGAVLTPQRFDPAVDERTLRILSSDYLDRVALAPLATLVRAEAPGLTLTALPVSAHVARALAEGQADLALGVSFAAPEGLKSRVLCKDRFVCVARPSSWTCGDDPARWAALPHALVSPGGRPGAPVDRALTDRGLRRRVALTLPHFGSALEIVAHTDLVITLPERLARALAPPDLLIRPPPVPMDPYEILALWHPRAHADPALRWLRERLAAALAPARERGVAADLDRSTAQARPSS